MKRLGLITIALGALMLIAGFFINTIGQERQPRTALPTLTPVPSPTPIPTLLIIPKLNIKTQIDPVGITETNAMDVPKDATRVGWYMFGPTPSARGNAVITGHYDTPSGRPAIFYRLNKLVIGDIVEVELNNKTRYAFVVTGKDNIDVDIFPEEYVFGEKYGTNLNLITCNGVWDPIKKNYSKRLVVYATLKGTQFGTFQ